jgi:ATP-binding cassette subfamily C (CFTR/MRP) protein 4
VFIFCSILLALNREVTILTILLRSNRNLHDKMTEKISRSKMEFFDSNPVGRILTRFSKDTSLLDLLMPNGVILMSYGIFRTCATLVSLMIINIWLMIPVGIFVIFFILTLRRAAHVMVDA